MNEKLDSMGSRQRDSRDEDLALFHDMRRRERRNFLYPLKDDIDASPKHDETCSTFCLSASTPSRSGHDLLSLDSEKNDYDWLLTPPSTPLFPSLDQDVPIVNLSQRRIFTRSTSVSKAARLSYPQEPSSRLMYGGNPSPRHPSTYSSTGSSINTNRGRPLSPSLTSRSSPAVRSSSPCRPTTPTGRNVAAASRSASRSLTPTLRHNNTSPSSAYRLGLTNGRSRGKSLSPKLGPWEPSLPGFSTEPPPNLRTSLSDRTIQRGLSPAPKNGGRSKGSYVEISEGGGRSLGHANSHDGDGISSLSYGNDLNSSQTSRASVVSSCDDDVDMAESVMSGSTRTSFDSQPKSMNSVITKLENPSIRKSVLPAKRHMKPAGTTGDSMSFLSIASRKPYERQGAQRRSTETMFRPLLSSAPITSFYSTRFDGKNARSSSHSMESSAIQNGNKHLSRNDGLCGEVATEVASGHVQLEHTIADSAGGDETIKDDDGGGSPLEEKALKCQSGLELKDKEGPKILSDLETQKKELHSEGCRSKDAHSGFCILPAQPPLQHHTEDHEGQGDKQLKSMDCDVDSYLTRPNIPDDGCIERKHAFKGHRQTMEGEHILDTSMVKEYHVEDHRVINSVKPHVYLGAIGTVSSQHGSQRALSDLGSFRKQSPMKSLNTRSQDGSMITEKAFSCDSFPSDSHSFFKSLASAFSYGELTEAPLERQGDAMEADPHSESTAMWNKKLPSSLEGDVGMCLSLISTETLNDTSDSNVSSDSYSKSAHLNHYSGVNQAGTLEDHSQVSGLMREDSKDSVPEAFSGKMGESLVSDASDKLSQRDIQSIFGSCALSAAMLEDVAVQHDCTAAPNHVQSGRFSDVMHSTSQPATDASERDDLSYGQEPEVSLLKRSVTLEEATDTILFCSSIIHELVYKSATLAIENEEQKVSKRLVLRRDFVTLFGFSGAEHKADGGKAARPRNWKQQQLSEAAVCKSSFVQKQRMVHRQTPAVTMQQSSMDRIENAIMGNHEEIRIPIVSQLQKGKVKQGKRVHCRCSCCMM